jgi:transposase
MSSTDEKPKNENHKAINRAKNQIGILRDTVDKQGRKISELEKQVERLKKENDKLKKELASKRQIPKWVKPNKSEEQIKNAKKRGPKPGHPCHPRRRPDNVDQTIVVFPEQCPEGHGELPFPSDSKWHSHVQIDLPEPGKPIVTEFLVGSSYCADCGKYHSAEGRVSGSLYGPRLHAHVCYWKYSLGLSFLKIQKLLKEQYGLSLSTGQLSEIVTRTAKKFEDAYDDLKTSLHDQSHLHVDETGWRLDGKNGWLWSFSNQDISVYAIDPSRSQGVVEEILGAVFGGVLCSDFYGAYHKIQSEKQKCWAHILRDLKNLREKDPSNLEIQYFASRLKNFFERGKQLREDKVVGKDIGSRLKRLKSDTEFFACRKFKHPELQTLAKRLIKYRREMYTFIEKNLEPTNNNAEREIRPAVLMRKISYGNRSDQGRQNQAILMSIIRTAHKRGQNFVAMATGHLAGLP